MENDDDNKEESSNETFGKLVKKYRETEGISQDTFAAEIGITSVYLSQIENGHANITFNIADSIATKYPRLAFKAAVVQLAKDVNTKLNPPD